MKARIGPIVKQILLFSYIKCLYDYFENTIAYHLGWCNPLSPYTKGLLYIELFEDFN